MTYEGENQRKRRPAGLSAWLVLAAALLLPFAAAHELEHSLEETGESCFICIQLESGTSLDTSVSHALAPPVSHDDTLHWNNAPHVTVAWRTPQLRAPPALI